MLPVSPVGLPNMLPEAIARIDFICLLQVLVTPLLRVQSARERVECDYQRNKINAQFRLTKAGEAQCALTSLGPVKEVDIPKHPEVMLQ